VRVRVRARVRARARVRVRVFLGGWVRARVRAHHALVCVDSSHLKGSKRT